MPQEVPVTERLVGLEVKIKEARAESSNNNNNQTTPRKFGSRISKLVRRSTNKVRFARGRKNETFQSLYCNHRGN